MVSETILNGGGKFEQRLPLVSVSWLQLRITSESKYIIAPYRVFRIVPLYLNMFACTPKQCNPFDFLNKHISPSFPLLHFFAAAGGLDSKFWKKESGSASFPWIATDCCRRDFGAGAAGGLTSEKLS